MAPDLRTIVSVEGLEKRRAREIARASERRRNIFRVLAVHRGFGGPWWLELPEVHDSLADEADWNALIWAIEPEGLERLARTLEWLYSELPGEFTFETSWGDEPIEKLVSRDELLRIISAGRVGTRTRYRVSSTVTESPQDLR
jgi:hypothetical protein